MPVVQAALAILAALQNLSFYEIRGALLRST